STPDRSTDAPPMASPPVVSEAPATVVEGASGAAVVVGASASVVVASPPVATAVSVGSSPSPQAASTSASVINSATHRCPAGFLFLCLTRGSSSSLVLIGPCDLSRLRWLRRRDPPVADSLLDVPEQLGETDPQERQRQDGGHQEVGPEDGSIRRDQRPDPAQPEIHLGDGHTDHAPADAEAHPGEDEGDGGGDDHPAQQAELARDTESPGDLDQVGGGVADTGVGVDQDREEGRQEHDDDPAQQAEPEPDQNQRNQRHHRQGVEPVEVGAEGAVHDPVTADDDPDEDTQCDGGGEADRQQPQALEQGREEGAVDDDRP